MFSKLSSIALEVRSGISAQWSEIGRKNDEYAVTDTEEIMGKGVSLFELIERSRDGDIQAIEALFEHFKGSLFNLIYRFIYNHQIAEDLLQETFLKVFIHIQEVDRVETFKSWLYRIAVNNCYSYLRGIKTKQNKTLSLSDVEAFVAGKSDDPERKEMKSSLDRAIQSLTPKLKSVFILHDVQGFKHVEIARMLGWSVGTSKSQLFKARMKIRNYLKSH